MGEGKRLDRIEYDRVAVEVNEIERDTNAGGGDIPDGYDPEASTATRCEARQASIESGRGEIGGFHVGAEEALPSLVVGAILACFWIGPVPGRDCGPGAIRLNFPGYG